MLVLALMLDGCISRADWKFIQRAAGSARPPLEAKWSSTVYLVNMQLDETENGMRMAQKTLGKHPKNGEVIICFSKSKSNLAYLSFCIVTLCGDWEL